MDKPKTLQERIDDLTRAAEAGEVFLAASAERMRDRMYRELVRRGYDIEGKGPEEISEIVSHPPTLPEKP